MYLLYWVMDICKLSDIADSWQGKITDSKDFMELFFEGLPVWGLPVRRLELPKPKQVMGRKNVLAGCHRFIVRQMFNSKMSITQYNKYMKRIEYYNSGRAELAKYTSDHECWSNQGIKDYDEFSKVLKEFIIGENLDENKRKLLGVDYCIVENVLEIDDFIIKNGRVPSQKEYKNENGLPSYMFITGSPNNGSPDCSIFPSSNNSFNLF